MTNYKQPLERIPNKTRPTGTTTIEEIVDSLEPYFKSLYVSGSFSVFNLKIAIKKSIKDYGDAREANAKKEVAESLRMEIEKYQKSKEVILNGQRFLIVDKAKKPFGYPYPDSKEKYLIRELKTKIDNIINQSEGLSIN